MEAASAPLPSRVLAMRERLAQWHSLDQAPGNLPAVRRLLDQVRLAARTRTGVLIVGEAGAGKQWLARVIHQQGPARERCFLALDCGCLPSPALAAVLWGEGGAARWSSIGTLYLREPAGLPRDLQARVADLLADPEAARPQVIAGSRTNPADDVRAGRLLPELHGTLATLVIEVPLLRERRAELPWLVERLLPRAGLRAERPIGGLTPEAWALIEAYAWPGNIRELSAVLAGACARAAGDRIDAADLPAYLRLEQTPGPAPERPLPLDPLLEQVERRLIELALHKCRGNRSRAAELLAIWRPRLVRRIETLGIDSVRKRGQSP
jgi:DNA-binding NtrC family response regulator